MTLKPIKLTAIFCFILILAGCSQKQTKSDEDNIALNFPQDQSSTPEQLLSEAANSLEPGKSNLLLQAGLKYQESGLVGQSKAVLNEVDPAHLGNDEKLAYAQLKKQIAVSEGDLDTLSELIPIYDSLILYGNIDTQIEAIRQKVETHKSLEQHIEAALTLAESQGLFEPNEQEENQEDIWKSLRLSSTADITRYDYQGDNYDIKGWLELASTFKLNQSNLDNQAIAITNWIAAWTLHPAASNPPREIQILQSLPESRPSLLTLALPLSGPLEKVGKAVRDGFFAEFYRSSKLSKSTLNNRVELFDTHAKDIEKLYAQSNDENSIIIGPLDKMSLSKISKLDSIDTTTIALNSSPEQNKHPKLYQFTLQPESGTGQIVERLLDLNLKKVAIIAPETEWGFRIHDKFVSELIGTNGILIESVFYGNQASLSDSVSELLATKDSKNRAREVRRITGLSLDNEPRRRQDLDAIFMVAQPQTAKLLKPLFAFHYASDIPIFSSSQVHDPNTQNNDLNGINFVEMPWMLSTTDDTKNNIKKLSPDQLDKYSRFYALGIDAFKLAPRLNLLSEIPDSQLEGQTGILRLNESNEIVRTMQWSKFHRGKAIPIND